MQHNHLFLFTIGPVQGFIAHARRTRDLYAGSGILSALVKAGMDAFALQFPAPAGKILFPVISSDSKSLPNRFIGKVEGDADSLHVKAKNIQRAVEDKWQSIAAQSLRKTGVATPVGFDPQIQAHVDIHWVFQPINGSYAEAYAELETLGGAIKNVRSFEQYAYAGTRGETGRKCSIDGMNNALFYKRDKERVPAFLTGASELPGTALHPGEALSAVSATKRFFLEDRARRVEFPSTSEVALMKDLTALQSSPLLAERLDCFKQLFEEQEIVQACARMVEKGLVSQININPLEEEGWNYDFDYQMLFEENLNEDRVPNRKQLELLRLLHPSLKSELKTKYYAVVLFDGDDMGKWLSGVFNQSKENLEEFHTLLSEKLSAFGNHARRLLDRSQGNGHTVYAGGDDFLGFVNIHCLFSVMKQLRGDFDSMVNQAITRFKLPDKHLNFSAGIVIAHYKTPFSEVLKNVRETEKKAKREEGKNTFGITVLKHSGEVQEAVYKWGADSKEAPADCSNWDALAYVVEQLEKDIFSPKFIQNISTEFFQLTGADLFDIDLNNRETKHLEDALLFETKRLIGRALRERSDKETNEKHVNDLYSHMKSLWLNAPQHHKVRHFIHALQTADFITRKTTQDR